MAINWQIMSDTRVYGYVGYVNGVKVELVRFYSGDWRINYGDVKYNSLSAAKKAARIMYS